MNPISNSVLCPWCKTYFQIRISGNCNNCGGPLPPPPGPERGDAPLPAPRFIPKQFKNTILFKKNYLLLFGVLWTIVNFPFVFHINGLDIFFMGTGIFCIWKGYDNAMKKVNVLKNGQITEGEITRAYENTATSINNKHPFVIEYSYLANGIKKSGKMNCWDDHTLSHYEGEPVWVVYSEKNFDNNSSIWPPIA